jgi:two-component system response regulator HydG
VANHFARSAPPVLAGTCSSPFESGPRLCKVCRAATDELGVRRCSRVVAESAEMRELMVRAARIAASDSPVVILGESGTGKEVLARTLHANSRRRAKSMVAVNVGAIPGELLESELFGHVRGAFTGAVERKVGFFEEADGSTLFLDEIAEMPQHLQVKLLRVLQDGEVRRVGEVRPFTVDVRILCATHRDLRALVAEGRFREDLYYRLKVFTLTLPPLRKRADDIDALVRQFLERAGRDPGSISPAALAVLRRWRWPGNIRELANAVEHAVVLAGDARVEVSHLPDEIVRPEVHVPEAQGPATLRSLAEVEREHVLRVLAACDGNQVDAAATLGIGRTTLWRKLRSYGVDPAAPAGRQRP